MEGAESLVSDQLVSRTQLDLRAAAQLKAAADLAADEAAVQMQDLNLSFTLVLAPLTGRAS